MALARDHHTKYTPPKRKNPKKKGKKKPKQRDSIELVTEQNLEERYQELKAMNVRELFNYNGPKVCNFIIFNYNYSHRSFESSREGR